MKMIIDIPEDLYNDMIKWVKVDGNFCSLVDEAIANATPLEKHDAEVIKETVASIWGKPPYTELLDEIRNEFIDRYPRNYANELELGGRSCVFSLKEILQIIDKYKGDKK